MFHNGGGATGRGDWMGGLLNEMRDASGLMYRRYYDPQTGRFTQEDPIGIAGGLNVYGYAAGDPVSYNDPFGLCAASQVQQAPSTRHQDQEKVCPGGLTHDEYYAREGGFSAVHQERYYARNTESRPEWRGCSMNEILFTQRQVHVRIGEWPTVMVDRLTWQVRRTRPSLRTIQHWELGRGNIAFFSGHLIAFGPEDRTVPAIGMVDCETGIGHFFASSSQSLLYGGR